MIKALTIMVLGVGFSICPSPNATAPSTTVPVRQMAPSASVAVPLIIDVPSSVICGS